MTIHAQPAALRQQLRDQGETLTTAENAALIERMDYLRRRDGK